MRYSPYLAEVSYAFSKTPHNYSEMALHWSEEGLEAQPPAYLQYTFPGSNLDMPLPFQKVSPIVKFLNLPDNQAAKGTLNATFSNGDALENSFVDVLFSAFLARLGVKYMPYQDESGKQALAAQISWQIDPLLINRVDHYTMQSPMVADNQTIQIQNETAYIIHSMASAANVPITLSAIGFDGLPLGSLTTTLYVPTLKIIPTRANVSGMGYGKQMDSSGIQEIYQVNHNKTIAQMTMPTQQHAQETQSLGDPLALMDPATVVSGKAREYIDAFDINQHNQAFDYSDAKEAGAKIAPQATASFNQQHQGNYTLEHQGTLNKTTNVGSYTELIQSPQINNTIQNYQGNFSGETFSKIIDGEYYEQVENETLIINEHSLEAPVYEENIGSLQEEGNNFNINAQNMMLQGDTFTHNGTIYLNGKFDLGYSGGYKPKPFSQPKRTPHGGTYAIIPPASDDYYRFLATVYGESAGVPAAWEAVADSIVLRAAQKNQTPGKIVAKRLQYDAFTEPLKINFDCVNLNKMRGHVQFLKAYAYLTKKTLNHSPPMTVQETKTLAAMDQEIRPIYALYTNKAVLLTPVILSSSPDQNDTCPEQYKQNNPANPLKYYITNYYSPQGQGNAPVAFLGNIPNNIDPDEYEVAVPNVTQIQFKFYNIPSEYH